MLPSEKIKRHRYLQSIILHVVWLYHRFMLSLGDVSELMLSRGIILSHETVRSWCNKFGSTIGKIIKRRAPRRGDKRHLDEMCVVMNKKKYWLWRAVDQADYELDILL